jgi:hypothetical protein
LDLSEEAIVRIVTSTISSTLTGTLDAWFHKVESSVAHSVTSALQIALPQNPTSSFEPHSGLFHAPMQFQSFTPSTHDPTLSTTSDDPFPLAPHVSGPSDSLQAALFDSSMSHHSTPQTFFSTSSLVSTDQAPNNLSSDSLPQPELDLLLQSNACDSLSEIPPIHGYIHSVPMSVDQQPVSSQDDLALSALKQHFSTDPSPSFKHPQQHHAVLMSLKRSENFIANFPTGLGKSLIYLLPTYVEPHSLTIVIIPFAALLRDQLFKAQAVGIFVHHWSVSNSSIPQGCRLLLVALESVNTAKFRRLVLLVLLLFFPVSPYSHVFQLSYGTQSTNCPDCF